MQPYIPDRATLRELGYENGYYRQQTKTNGDIYDNTLKIINPESGRTVILRDFSNENNRLLWDMVRQAKTEPGYKGKYSDYVRNILVQGFLKGRYIYFDQSDEGWNSVPKTLIRSAWDSATANYGIDSSWFTEDEPEIRTYELTQYHHTDGTVETRTGFEEREIILGENSDMSTPPRREREKEKESEDRPSSSSSSQYHSDDIYRVSRKRQKVASEFDWREPIPYVEEQEHFRGIGATFNISMNHLNTEERHYYVAHMAAIQRTLQQLLKQSFLEYGPYRVFVSYICVMGRMKSDDWQRAITAATPDVRDAVEQNADQETIVTSIEAGRNELTDKYEATRTTGFGRLAALILEELVNNIAEYQERGSGWVWLKSIRMEVKILKTSVGVSQKARLSTEEMNKLAKDKGKEKLVGEGYVRTPSWLSKKGCICNPLNTQDDKCFLWAILRGLHPNGATMSGRWSGAKENIQDLRQYERQVFMPQGERFQYPFKAKDKIFEKIEEANRSEFTFSVFYLGDDKGYELVEPMYLSKYKNYNAMKGKQVPHLRLGFLQNSKFLDNPVKHGHYVLIYNWRALNRKKSHKNAHYDYCERCLCNFHEEKLITHEELCRGNKPARAVMPKQGSKDHLLRFVNWKHKLQNPFVVYADFEALLQPNDDDYKKDTHIPCGWAYSISCAYDHHAEYEFKNNQCGEDAIFPPPRTLSEPRIYFGNEDPVKKFFDQITVDYNRMKWLIENDRQEEYELTPDEWEEHNNATRCWVCTLPFTPDPEDKVVDHDHHTGRYRGAAHRYCNTQITDLPKKRKGKNNNNVNIEEGFKLPIFFHNFTGYDCYHLLRGMGKFIPKVWKIDCIAKSLIKFQSLNINNFIFIDSKAFILGSLDKNVKLLCESFDTHPQRATALRQAFFPVFQYFEKICGDGLVDEDHFKKGIYPYEYMTSWDKLEETQLPSREHFSSRLNGGKRIKRKDLHRAAKMWASWKCKTLKDYTAYYCVLDVLLLQSVFDKFRDTCMHHENYGLDPSHYISAPSLSWNAMLMRNACKAEPIVIENITDQNMLMMVEKGIRGGLCQVMIPYSRANFQGMKSPLEIDQAEEKLEYDPTKKPSIIMAFDANNLYGWAMKQYLPIGDYIWVYDADWEDVGKDVDEKEYGLFADEMSTEIYLNDLVENGWDLANEVGYILEVDLEYPKELHNLHMDYPMAAENKVCDEVSEFTKNSAFELGGKQLLDSICDPKQKKLVVDFTPKKNYVVHYKLLQFYLKHGMKLAKVWKVMRFKQQPWLKKYVKYNSKKRKEAKKKGDKIATEFFKLMVNAIYGKTLERVRQRKAVSLATSEDDPRFLKKVNHPQLKHFSIILDDELMVMEFARQKVVLNKPTIVGMCILELSKLNMYRFHYDVMLKNFPPQFPGECPRARMIYTDTDSLIYQITAPYGGNESHIWDKLHYIQHEEKCFDLSENLAPDSPWIHARPGTTDLDVNMNAKKVGLMKCDMPFNIIEVVCLRSKMYSILQDTTGLAPKYVEKMQKEDIGKPCKTKKKGILSSIEISHQDYRKALNGEKLPAVEFHTFTHDKKMKIYTTFQKKAGPVGCDNKNYCISNTLTTRYGHWEIEELWKKLEEENENAISESSNEALAQSEDEFFICD